MLGASMVLQPWLPPISPCLTHHVALLRLAGTLKGGRKGGSKGKRFAGGGTPDEQLLGRLGEVIQVGAGASSSPF